jgi:hypothetical protein
MPRLVQPPSLESIQTLQQMTELLLDDGDGGQVPETLKSASLQENSTQSDGQDMSGMPHYRLRSDILTFSGDKGRRPAGGETCTAFRRRRSAAVGSHACLAKRKNELDFRHLGERIKSARPRNAVQISIQRLWIKSVELSNAVQEEVVRVGRGKQVSLPGGHARSLEYEPRSMPEIVGN